MNTNGSAKYIQSIERASEILRCFEDAKELGLTEISKITGLHKSTASGIINTLKKENFLHQNEETGKLRLGLELFRLSTHIQLSYRDICMPYLDDLMEITGETINLVMREGDRIVYIEKKESLHSMRICTKIGQQLPLHCTGAGKAILAFLPFEEINAILSRTSFRSFTKNTITNKEVLLEQMAEIQKNGYATDVEELEYGLICIGAPIFNQKNQPIAGISISGPITRMTSPVQKKICSRLIEATTMISSKMNTN